MKENMVTKRPLKRILQPEEVAKTVVSQLLEDATGIAKITV